MSGDFSRVRKGTGANGLARVVIVSNDDGEVSVAISGTKNATTDAHFLEAITLTDADVNDLGAWIAAWRDRRDASPAPPESRPIAMSDTDRTVTIRKRSGRILKLPTCPKTGKVIYADRAACDGTIKHLTEGNTRRRGAGMKKRLHAEAFVCEHCKGWHVGTSSKRSRGRA